MYKQYIAECSLNYECPVKLSWEWHNATLVMNISWEGILAQLFVDWKIWNALWKRVILTYKEVFRLFDCDLHSPFWIILNVFRLLKLVIGLKIVKPSNHMNTFIGLEYWSREIMTCDLLIYCLKWLSNLQGSCQIL